MLDLASPISTLIVGSINIASITSTPRVKTPQAVEVKSKSSYVHMSFNTGTEVFVQREELHVCRATARYAAGCLGIGIGSMRHQLHCGQRAFSLVAPRSFW